MVNVGGLHGHGDRDLVAVVLLLLPRVDGDGAVVGELVGVARQIQQCLPQAHLIGMQRLDCIVTIDPVRPRETKTARLTRELSEALKQQAATAVVGFLAAVRARQAGHAAAAPPRSVMNSRRLVRRHRIEDRTASYPKWRIAVRGSVAYVEGRGIS
jgi:hypothetical protein